MHASYIFPYQTNNIVKECLCAGEPLYYNTKILLILRIPKKTRTAKKNIYIWSFSSFLLYTPCDFPVHIISDTYMKSCHQVVAWRKMEQLNCTIFDMKTGCHVYKTTTEHTNQILVIQISILIYCCQVSMYIQ